MAKEELDAIEKLSFDALDKSTDVDFENILYIINQKSHKMKAVLELYCNVKDN